MSNFWIRVINVICIVGIIFSFNQIVNQRKEAEAIQAAEAKAQESENGQNSQKKYMDGTYQGSADGFGGKISVDVIIASGEISQIDITSAAGEDDAYLSMAKDIINKIIENQDAQVDTISGATFSSTGIKNAVAQALEGAGNEKEKN